MHNKDKPWFDNQGRRAVDPKQKANQWFTRDRSLYNWEEFVRCQVSANETNSESKRQWIVRIGDVLLTPSPSWALFGSSSPSSPLFGGGEVWIRAKARIY